MNDTPEARNPVTATRIQELLSEKDWKPSRLSLAAGLGKGAVADILADETRQPRAVTLAKLAGALGVDPEYLSGESDVRRAASRLHDGPGWSDDELPEGVAAVLESLGALAGDKGDGLRAYHLPPGVEGLGVAAGSTVIIQEGDRAVTGDLIVTLDPRQGYAIRYLAEPYMVGLDREGRVRHWLRSDAVRIVGKILLCVQTP